MDIHTYIYASQKPHAPIEDMSERAKWWPIVPGTLCHRYPHVNTLLPVQNINLPKQNESGRVVLVKQDTTEHHRQLPSLAFRSIFLFHLVKFASDAWLDGSKYFEV
jgi:hypothetical protein